MKRVRYLAGAAGLAPLVMGAAIAPGAPRAAAAPAASGSGKTVALLDAGCTGTTPAYQPDGSSYERFWYTVAGSLTCIGTVEYFEAIGGTGQDMRIRIYGPSRQFQGYYHGTVAPGGTSFAHTIRSYFGGGYNPVQVCVAAVFSKIKSVVVAGPICKTVP